MSDNKASQCRRPEKKYNGYMVEGPVTYGPANVYDSVPLTFLNRNEKKERGRIGQDYAAINEAFEWGLEKRNHVFKDLRRQVPDLHVDLAKQVSNQLRGMGHQADGPILGLPVDLDGDVYMEVVKSKIHDELQGEVEVEVGYFIIPTKQYGKLRVMAEYPVPVKFEGGKIMRYWTERGGIWRLGWREACEETGEAPRKPENPQDPESRLEGY